MAHNLTCNDCLQTLLPFYKAELNTSSLSNTHDGSLTIRAHGFTHGCHMEEKKCLLNIVHLNTQSLQSTFSEFAIIFNK